MTTSLFFSIYMYTMIILHPIEEIWNYNNPRPFPKKQYILVNWEQTDFIKIDRKYVLMKKHMHDEPLKAKARKRYYKFHF